MELQLVGSIATGDDQQFLACEFLPLADEIWVDVLEQSGGLGVVDLGHVHICVVVEWVTDRVVIGTVWVMRHPYTRAQTEVREGLGVWSGTREFNMRMLSS